jgi:hypothetical protein
MDDLCHYKMEQEREKVSETVSKGPSMAEIQNQLLATPIQNENDALNVMVSFLNLAQRRGVFSINESAKIWECIRVFQRSG